MDLEIGSNLYRNTDGTVEVEGVPQLSITLKTPDGPVLVSFVQFDELGRLTAKLVDNTLQFNQRNELALTKSPTNVTLTHQESAKVILQVDLKTSDRVTIKQANFTTTKGHTMEISMVEWRIEKRRQSGGDIDTKGGAASIG